MSPLFRRQRELESGSSKPQNITSIGRGDSMARKESMGVSVTFRARSPEGQTLSLGVLRELLTECDEREIEDTAVIEVFSDGRLVAVNEIAVTDVIR